MSWFTILGMSVITFVNRYAFFAQWLRFQPNEKMLRFLSFSSYAILTAIWMPIVFQFDPAQGFSYAGMDYLIATSLAVIMAILKAPSIIIVIISSIAFFALRFLVFAS